MHKVNAAAFDTPAEANLVDIIRKEASPIISLVAEKNGKVMGHILFSPLTLSGNTMLKFMGLGLVVVMPTHQEKGIGSALVKRGLEECKKLGAGAVIVLGLHWLYPPRWGEDQENPSGRQNNRAA